MKKLLFFLLITLSFGQTPIKNRAIYTDTVRAWLLSGTTFPGALNFTGLGNAAYKANLHLGANNKLYISTDTSGSGSNPTKAVLIDTLNNTGVTANIDFTGNTITAGTWAGTSIDTAYTNAVSKIVAGNTFLTATKNAKDYTLTPDTSKYATASVTGFLKYADFVTFNNSLDAGDTTTFRTFSDLKYLKNADSTTFRTASNVYYAPKIGSANITTLGTITTGTWNGTSIDTAYTNAVSKLNNGLYTTAASGGSKTYKVNVDTASIATTGTGQNITAQKIFTVAPKFTGLSTIDQSPNLHLGADNKLYFTNDTTSSGGNPTKQVILDTLLNTGVTRSFPTSVNRQMLFQEEFLGNTRNVTNVNVAAGAGTGVYPGSSVGWNGLGFRTGTGAAQSGRSSGFGNEETPAGIDTSAFGVFGIDPDSTLTPATPKGIIFNIGAVNATSTSNIPYSSGLVYRTRIKMGSATDSIGWLSGIGTSQAFATANVATHRRVAFCYGQAGVGSLDSIYAEVSDGTTEERLGVQKVVASTWYTLSYIITASGVDFYVDDVYKLSLNTNEPLKTTGGAIQIQAWSFDFNTALANNKKVTWDYIEVSRITPQSR